MHYHPSPIAGAFIYVHMRWVPIITALAIVLMTVACSDSQPPSQLRAGTATNIEARSRSFDPMVTTITPGKVHPRPPQRPGSKGTVPEVNEPPGSSTNGTAARFDLRRLHRLDSYHNSPARSTPECRTIVEILKSAGLDEECVPDVYTAVWACSTNTVSNGNILRHRHLQWRSYLAVEFGLTNQAILRQLFALQPTQAWGIPLRTGD